MEVELPRLIVKHRADMGAHPDKTVRVYEEKLRFR